MTVTNPDIDLALARHPDTPASVLQRLSKDLEAETRVAVAKHPNTAQIRSQSLLRTIPPQCEQLSRRT
jgi:uncharacterized protein with gpF-like domain